MSRKRITTLLMTAAVAIGFAAAGQTAYAQQSEKGLKDIYANYFRIGTCYPSQQTSDQTLRNVILREFNSVTHENELKPDATMQQSGSTDDDIKVALNNARSVLVFCTTYNVPLRGHTLVWHSQTPQWFFYANMQNGNQQNLATKQVMCRRMESYIKNMFAIIAREFPTLKLYAYDVVNEVFENNGKPRTGGFGGDNSPWVQVFGDNSFVDSAFTYARKYAPANCKLFYNDFNEYHPDGKRDSIVALYNRLKARNVIDGIGMQSHLSTSWPDIGTYKSALNRFIGTGAEIHVTELDLTIESGSNEAAQTEKYKNVFQAYKEAREEGANITSVSVWGVRDDLSWRKDKNPLLFTQNYTKKPAYNQISALIPEKDHGNGTNPQFNTPTPGEATADENGYFFHHDFENGTTQGWGRRGDETVANSGTQNNTKNGSKSIYVSGRNQNWNGAQFALPSDFKAGQEYSFSVMARHEGSGALKFKLSLQYENAAGEKQYPNIDSVEAASGQWVQLSTTSYKLPAGTGFSIYVELDNASASFYVDDAMGGVKGATIKPDGTPGTPSTSVLNGKNTVRGNTPLVTIMGRTLNVNAGTDSKVRVRVVNMMGKTVANFNAAGNAALSLKKIPAGAYVIEAKRIKDGYRTTSAVILK